MILKAVQQKKLILAVSATLLLVCMVFAGVLGNEEDRIRTLVLSWVFPFLVYGALRLGFKLVRIRASLGYLKFVTAFFLTVSVCGVVVSCVLLVTDFSGAYGTLPMLACCLGCFNAFLAEAEKNIKIETEK